MHQTGSELSELSEVSEQSECIRTDLSYRSYQSGSELSECIRTDLSYRSYRRGSELSECIRTDLSYRSYRSGSELSECIRTDLSYRSDTTACGRTNHSPQSEGLRPERLGVGVPCEVSDLPIVGGRTRAIGVDQSSRRTRLALIQRTHRSCIPTGRRIPLPSNF